MSYVSFGQSGNSVTIIDTKLQLGTQYELGELLFSFLDIDLREYNSLLSSISSQKDFTYLDLLSIMKKYPKTTQNRSSIFNSISKNLTSNEYRNFALFFLLDNKDTFSNLYEHDAFFFSGLCKAPFDLNFNSYKQDIDFFYFQQKLKSLIEFCYLEKNSKIVNLTINERYFLFAAATPLLENKLYLRRTVYPYSDKLFDKTRTNMFDSCANVQKWWTLGTSDILDLINNETIKEIHENAKLLNVNLCETFFDFLAFEFLTILSQDIVIKKCTNCGRLFIPTGRYNTDCCDRIPEGGKYPCKKIMAQKRRKEKLKKNPIINEYERAYKRNYARVSNHRLSNENFRLWVEEASEKRNKVSAEYEANPSELIIKEFKKYLGNK